MSGQKEQLDKMSELLSQVAAQLQKNGMPMRACDAFHAAHSVILRAGGYMSALCCARPAVYDSKMA